MNMNDARLKRLNCYQLIVLRLANAHSVVLVYL